MRKIKKYGKKLFNRLPTLNKDKVVYLGALNQMDKKHLSNISNKEVIDLFDFSFGGF